MKTAFSILTCFLFSHFLVAQCPGDIDPPVLDNLPEDQVFDCFETPPPPTSPTWEDCDPFIINQYSSEETVLGEECRYVDSFWEGYNEPGGLLLFVEDDRLHFFHDQIALQEYIGPNELPILQIDGYIHNEANTGGFEYTMMLEGAYTWEELSAMPYPTTYHADGLEVGSEYEDWTYYLMIDGSEMTGWGDYAGYNITLTHAPANNFYVFQRGLYANNASYTDGIGGWFYADGTGQFGQEIDWQGDLSLSWECCTERIVEHTWTFTDSSGNEYSHTQTQYFVGQDSPLQSVCPCDLNSDDIVNASDLLRFVSEFGNNSEAEDFIRDGSVDSSDLMFFLSRYGTFCEE